MCNYILNFRALETKIMASGPITSWQQMGKQWKQCQTLFFGALKSLQMVTATIKLIEEPHPVQMLFKISL